MPLKTSINICNDIDVVILCGGRGRRLRQMVNDRPKVMAKIGPQPFLDLLIAYLRSLGFRRFILCIGYKGNFIRQYYGSEKRKKLGIVFSSEISPMGTGGALKKAKNLVHSNSFLVLNGDSFIRLNIQKLIKTHIDNKALITMVLCKCADTKDYGSVMIDKASRITGFEEKSGRNKLCLTNCGAYLCGQEIFSLMPRLKGFSLEYDFFPKIIKNDFYGCVANDTFVDIGTPRKYKRAKLKLRSKFIGYPNGR